MIAINQHLQNLFLTARDTEFEAGRPGTAYIAGLQAVLDTVEPVIRHTAELDTREQVLQEIRHLADNTDMLYDLLDAHPNTLPEPGQAAALLRPLAHPAGPLATPAP